MKPTSLNLGKMINNGELLFHLFNSGNFVNLPTNTGWDTANTGTGAVFTSPAYIYSNTGITANSTSRSFCSPMGLDTTDYTKFNFDKRILICFNVGRLGSDTEVIGRIQTKTVITEGALAALGLGIQISNYTIIGETYNAARGTTATLYTLSDKEVAKVTIAHYPGQKVEYYINGELKAIYSTVANIPSGSAGIAWVNSLINGATGGVSTFVMISQIQLWQEK